MLSGHQSWPFLCAPASRNYLEELLFEVRVVFVSQILRQLGSTTLLVHKRFIDKCFCLLYRVVSHLVDFVSPDRIGT